MVGLEWYRSFLEVYRVGTVSGAARVLNLTQPAVSRHLAALEQAVGAVLFVRTPRRMIPTERGKELYSDVVRALEQLETVSRNLNRRVSEEKPVLRIGAPREYFTACLLDRIAALPCRLWVSFGLAQALIAELQAGTLDAVVATQKIPHPELVYHRIDVESFIPVGPRAVDPPPVTVWTGKAVDEIESWLRGRTWISFGPELPIIRRAWREIFNRRADIKPALVLPDLGAILQAVAAGRGVSFLPEYLCREALADNRIRTLVTLPRPVTNDIWYVCRKPDRGAPLVTAFLDAVLSRASA